MRRKHHGGPGPRGAHRPEDEMSAAREGGRESQPEVTEDEAGQAPGPEPGAGESREVKEEEPAGEEGPGLNPESPEEGRRLEPDGDREDDEDQTEPPSIDDLDPRGNGMKQSHRHLNEPGGDKREQRCYCGAKRQTGLMRSSPWSGGVEQETPWQRAHLLAVQRAVGTQEDLPKAHPTAVLDLHRTLMQDPPRDALTREDLDSLKVVYRMALGAAERMMEWHLENGGADDPS